jgi:hypothetical protein
MDAMRAAMSLLITAAALANATGISRAPADKVETEAENILAMNAGLPVEYQADALFRLLQSGKLSSKTVRDSLLNDLFARSETAIQPSPLVYIGPDANDTREGRLPSALRSAPLDALSIQVETVQFLSLDKPLEAMELFGQIRNSPVSATCDVALLPESSIYYRELASLFALLRKRYPAKTASIELWLETQLGKVSSFLQAEPATELISSIGVSNVERQHLASLLAARLISLDPSSRDFSAETISHSLGNDMLRLSRQDSLLTGTLVSAYATVLEHVFREPQCSDQVGALRNTIDWFNGNAAPMIDAHSAKVDPSALVSPKTLGTWQVHELDDLSRFGGLLRKLFALRDGPAGYIASENEPATNSNGWELDAGALLDGLRQWDETEAQCQACVFDRKSMMYLTLLDYLPAGQIADRAVAGYLDFMASSSMETRNPAEWFDSFRMFLSLLREPSPQEQLRLANAKASGKLLNFLPSPFAHSARNKA